MIQDILGNFLPKQFPSSSGFWSRSVVWSNSAPGDLAFFFLVNSKPTGSVGIQNSYRFIGSKNNYDMWVNVRNYSVGASE